MSIIVAFLLFLVLIFKLVFYGQKEGRFDENLASEKEKEAEWEQKVDPNLESDLKMCMKADRYYDCVCDEVVPVLNNTKYWKPTDGDGARGVAFKMESVHSVKGYHAQSDLVQETSDMALDIMLANRGKVSEISIVNGYPMFFDGTRSDERERYFERANVILSIVREHYPDADLANIPGRYVWVNSLGYNSNLHGYFKPEKFKLQEPPLEFPKK